MLLGYLLHDYRALNIKIPIAITLPLKISNILISGKSGSGKSLTARWYLFQLLHNKESKIYLSDYKGGEEYSAFEGSRSYGSGVAAIQMIDYFYDFFTQVRNRRIRLKEHYTLFIEEWFGLLVYAESQSKKLKTELMGKVAELLAVSRGINMGVILCIQRADSSNFASGSREQFQCVISFGRCSSEQFRMLGFSGELEENPTRTYKAGHGLALIDGQESIEEIIVPYIKNSDAMCQAIRSYLDFQPDILTLTRAIAAGEGSGL